MLVEINIGLLGAVAIVASMLNAVFETKFYNRWAAYSVAGFGLSGVLSTIVLFDTVKQHVFGTPSNIEIQWILTYGSIFCFLASTEVLILIAFIKFWRKGRVRGRK